MNTKTMEGLVGARTNINLLNTPMRVYREARNKGDTDTMERALGYARDFSDQAEEYKKKVDKGMKEEAKENREKLKSEREEALKKRREEREKLEKISTENKNPDDHIDADTDSCDAGERPGGGEGKVLVKEPVTYTKTGEAVKLDQDATISVLK